MNAERIGLSLAKPSVERHLKECLDLGRYFEEPPKIELELASRTLPGQEDVGTRDIVITTAYQCYSSGVPAMKKRRDERAQIVADSTLKAGHHTTRQHPNFTWRMVGVSRSVTHDIFHSHPFYNTEQQSQRYVEAERGGYIAPANLTETQESFYNKAAEFSNKAYFELLDLLKPEVSRRVSEMYPKGSRRVSETAERLDSKGKKICQEIARYVLPIAQKTNFAYTLSELQLIRMFRASRMAHYPVEAKYVIARMIEEVAFYDPTILQELDDPYMPSEELDFNEEYITEQKREFDVQLDGWQSNLLTLTQEPSELKDILATAVRNVMGLSSRRLSNSEALEILANPAKNHLLADVYDVGMLDPLTSVLRQVTFSFATKLSHTADSQRQRQRRTPGSTPSIEAIYDGKPDYITPLVIQENPQLKEVYDRMVERIYKNVNEALERGVPKEWALLLLPNAQTIRVIETGDLFDFHHRWKQRLCFLAQEEIFFISVEQIKQVMETVPELTNTLLAPCGIRQTSGIKPRCPEGNRWCGRTVYNWQIDKYKENRLI